LVGEHRFVDDIRESAFKDAEDFHAAVTAAYASLEQFTRWWKTPRLNQSDAVERRVEWPISATRQPMPLFVR
jgi:hypothetical protein